MSWIAWVGVIAGGAVLLLAAALSWPLRLRGRVDENGPAGGVGWLGIDVNVDVGTGEGGRTVVVRWLGVRLLRRPLPGRNGDEATGDAKGVGDAPDGASASRLSLASWRVLVRTGLREARRVVRRVRVEHLRLDAVIASDDPALTGELFGYGSALVAAARTRWPGAELQLGFDFERVRPWGRAELALRVRPIGLVGSALRMARVYRRERRRSARAA